MFLSCAARPIAPRRAPALHLAIHPMYFLLLWGAYHKVGGMHPNIHRGGSILLLRNYKAQRRADPRPEASVQLIKKQNVYSGGVGFFGVLLEFSDTAPPHTLNPGYHF